jgi:outer membrane protein assembly factor BamB
VVSASGTANPIVWTSTHSGSNAILYALNASNLANEYYDSTQAASSRDAGPAPVKFTSPVVANGMVFVGGTSSLVVYGLLP